MPPRSESPPAGSRESAAVGRPVDLQVIWLRRMYRAALGFGLGAAVLPIGPAMGTGLPGLAALYLVGLASSVLFAYGWVHLFLGVLGPEWAWSRERPGLVAGARAAFLASIVGSVAVFLVGVAPRSGLWTLACFFPFLAAYIPTAYAPIATAHAALFLFAGAAFQARPSRLVLGIGVLGLLAAGGVGFAVMTTPSFGLTALELRLAALTAPGYLLVAWSCRREAGRTTTEPIPSGQQGTEQPSDAKA